MLVKKSFFAKYSDYWMAALNKAYFNQQSKLHKFTPIDKHIKANKPVLYTYKNSKNKKFGVFIPINLGNIEAQNFSPAITWEFSEVLAFLQQYKGKRLQPAEDEFFLLPLMDHEAQHWTVLKINLSESDEFSAEHYDPSVNKKSAVTRYIRKQLKDNLPNFTELATPFLLQQLDPVNCGPFGHKIIKQLAKGEKPAVLPKTGFSYREKDLKLLTKAKDAQIAPDTKNFFQGMDYFQPNLPFLVHHRNKFLFGAGVLLLGVTIGLLVVFPPAGIVAAAVGTAATAATVAGLGGLSSVALGGILAGVTVTVGFSMGTAIKGIYSAISWLARKIRPKAAKIFNYNEDQFRIVNYVPEAPIVPDAAPVHKEAAKAAPDADKEPNIKVEEQDNNDLMDEFEEDEGDSDDDAFEVLPQNK